MTLHVCPIKPVSFGTAKMVSQPQKKTGDENPVSIVGERMNLVTATFIGGLGLGARLLAEVWDSEFLAEKLANTSKKLIEKNKHSASPFKKTMLTIAGTFGLIALAVGAFAILYTVFNAPKIAYNSKINAFQKCKDMNAYIQGNKAEKELYTQLNSEARKGTTTEQEKEQLYAQYMQLQAAKNSLPAFLQKTKKPLLPQNA